MLLRTVAACGRVEKLWKDPTFTEHSLLKNKALIDLRVFRTKNTTKKEVGHMSRFTIARF